MKSQKSETINAAVYARFSSDNQRDESIDAQLRAIEEYASKNGINIVERYIDKALSARSDKRPEFQRMIKDSNSGKFKMVIVHKLDRFSRDRYDSAYYKHVLKNNGVRLQSVVENFDNSPESIILESVIEGMAEYYSANLGRETIKGLKENAHNGVHTGGRPPLGYKINPITKRIEVDENEAKAIKLIFGMVYDGEKYSAVADELNKRGYKTRLGRLFTSASLHDILKNPKYIGVCIYNKRVSRSVANSSRKFKDSSEWIINDTAYPPIVSREVFDDVQKRLEERKVSGQSHSKEVYLLSGKIKCGICGGAYCGERKTSGKGVHSYSYSCNNRKKHPQFKCSNPSVNRSVLEQFVLQKLAETVVDDLAISELTSGYNKYLNEQNSSSLQEISEYKRELRNVDEMIDTTVTLLVEMKSTALKDKLTELEKKKSYINKRISELSKENASMTVTEKELKNVFETIRSTIARGTLSNVKQLIDIYVDSITVYPEKVVVVFNFIPSIKLERQSQNFNNGECADFAHSPFLSYDELNSRLVFKFERQDIVDLGTGKRLYQRLRAFKPP